MSEGAVHTEVKAALQAKSEAYLTLRRYYRDVFGTPEGALVLADLRRFCRADKTTHVVDDPYGRASANLEGRKTTIMYVEAMRSDKDDLMRALIDP